MFANGTVGNGGPYDGIVTLNSAVPYQFTRPTSASNFDAQRSTEHEIDEVMGLGSRLNISGNDLRPQDVFSWSSAGRQKHQFVRHALFLDQWWRHQHCQFQSESAAAISVIG